MEGRIAKWRHAETGARNSLISSVPDLVVVAGFGISSNEPKEDKR